MGPVTEEPPVVYLLGKEIGHSLAPPVHNYIATVARLPWNFQAHECDCVEYAASLIRRPSFAGAIVTMPYKQTIMKYLDGVDDLAITIGACNNIYIARDGTLRGTNTDWLGVAGCLQDGIPVDKGRPALVVGAGGASRAAIYALYTVFDCRSIYIINRDEQEVLNLAKEIKMNYPDLEIEHVKTPAQAAGLWSPYYIVGTIPDADPQSREEMNVFRVLDVFLSKATMKGALLDMCYHPRRTQLLTLAGRHGWKTIEGIAIIGHQIETQYKLWCNGRMPEGLPIEGAWKTLFQIASR